MDLSGPATVQCATRPGVVWQPGAACSFIDPLAVFRFQLPALNEIITCVDQLLTPAERDRAGRFHQPMDRLRFVAGRWLLRTVIGQYTHQPADRVDVTLGPTQKPMLVNADGWQINLAHAGDWVLLAVGREPVGVDLEQIDDSFDYQPIVAAGFSPIEQQFVVSQLTDDNRRRAFYQLWTRKEALVKATALGLPDALDHIPALDGAHRIAAQWLGDAGSWTVQSFDVDDAHPAALAHRQADTDPVLYTISPDFIH